jgi:16S rRNA processing protein RimM
MSRRNPSRRRDKGSGDEVASEPEFLVVGRILRPHGVRGELRMQVITDYPERLAEREMLYVGPTHEPHRLIGVRSHHHLTLLKFEGVTDREAADAYRDMLVYVSMADAVPLEPGEFYLFQLVGLRVITADGQELGRVVDVLETGANDVYVVRGETDEMLLPDIPEVVLDVDVEAGQMQVQLIEGLI